MSLERHGRENNYNEMMTKAQDALKLLESKASGLTVEEVKSVLGELHTKIIDMEIANDEIIRAQRELERSYNKYAHLFDSFPMGLVTLDAEGSIMEANLAFAEIIGEDRRKLIRRHVCSLVYSQDHKTFRTFLDMLRKSVNSLECEIRILKDSIIYRIYVTGVKLYIAQNKSENYLLNISIM